MTNKNIKDKKEAKITFNFPPSVRNVSLFFTVYSDKLRLIYMQVTVQIPGFRAVECRCMYIP